MTSDHGCVATLEEGGEGRGGGRTRRTAHRALEGPRVALDEPLSGVQHRTATRESRSSEGRAGSHGAIPARAAGERPSVVGASGTASDAVARDTVYPSVSNWGPYCRRVRCRGRSQQ